MKKRKILYRLGSSGRDEWMYNLSIELQKTIDHESFFFCSESGILFLKDKVSRENTLFIDEEQNKIENPDLQLLSMAEKKFNFNIWDIWELVAQRGKRRYRIITSKEILINYEQRIKEFDSFLDRNQITDFIIYGPAASSDLILFNMMKQKNIKIIELYPSPLQKRFSISKNLNKTFYGLKENYDKLKKQGLTNEEREKATKVLKEYSTSDYKPDCVVGFSESKIKKIKRYSKAGWKMIKRRQYPSIRPFLWGSIQKFYDSIGIFENPKPGEKYVLFPLHYQPEASILIYGKWYNNQLNLIENLIRSIPVGYRLYVKEHNYGYGNRHLRFYKEIKKYANVKLINPHSNNLELIRNASLVITIAGTVGWESIILQKPTIVFGDTFYDCFDCIKKVERIKDLPIIVRETIDKQIKYEETLICVASLIKSTYPGLALLPETCANHSLKEENIKLLVDGITDNINKIQ